MERTKKIKIECDRHGKALKELGVKSYIETGICQLHKKEAMSYKKINATKEDGILLMMEVVKDIRDDITKALECDKKIANKTIMAGIAFELMKEEGGDRSDHNHGKSHL